jgi:hypothetical protein
VPCPGTAAGPGKSETSYLKYLSFTGQIELEWGMRAEMDNKTALTAAWRDHARAARFEGGKCGSAAPCSSEHRRLREPECRAQKTQTPFSCRRTCARALAHHRLPRVHAAPAVPVRACRLRCRRAAC